MTRPLHHLHKICESCVLVLPQIITAIPQIDLTKKVVVIEKPLGVCLEERLSFSDLALNHDGLVALLEMCVEEHFGECCFPDSRHARDDDNSTFAEHLHGTWECTALHEKRQFPPNSTDFKLCLTDFSVVKNTLNHTSAGQPEL